jgi:hypothetical protein
MIYVVGVLIAVSLVQSWLLWRLFARVGSLPRLDERVSSLTHTIALLTDATESCFNTIAAQLDAAPPARPTSGRATRQRRVVGAAKIGRSVTEIAAAEDLAETEVRLRLHMAEQTNRYKETSRGAMRS